jgi:YesN/AraC family two-component response regulator
LIKVLVVDDHELVRSGISRLLTDAKGIEVVGEAASGEEAVQFAKEHSPDIILMDIRMPGIGGLEATRKITRHRGKKTITKEEKRKNKKEYEK